MELFSTIRKEGEYWLVDQVKQKEVSEERYREAFAGLLSEWRGEKSSFLSLLMDPAYEDWLLGQGFRKISVITEYSKRLDGSEEAGGTVRVESLGASSMFDREFADLYDRCRSGSANKNKLFTMDQIMESLSHELGDGWRSHCFIFWQGEEPAGVSIPHIEAGTETEGRLFYFGVTPENRGKGLGTLFHRLSLGLLHDRFGAETYVGSTDEENRHMIGIFERNGCRLRDKKGIYRLERQS
ncbi:GNAT family N-acetyltransferase [Indiicoccus explosivorum]|uniref:GNAT family N-acetyltransferase n=1 Tax=Indiicoccus explosivorum TaxID=1917864 RepID=UPI000B449EBE|nr:GNAT family N-acetyltransferase [Indiicoccus explosivorum]